MKYKLEINEETVKDGGDYYGDLWCDEYKTIGMTIDCTCGEKYDAMDGTQDEEDAVKDFTCDQCGAVWNHIENNEFELVKAGEE